MTQAIRPQTGARRAPMGGACTVVTTSYGAHFAAAVVGGGDHIALDYSTFPCDIGVYIGAANAGAHLDHATISGYQFGVYVDATNNVHIDHTAISTQNNHGSAGVVVDDSTGVSDDHTTTDGGTDGFAVSSFSGPTSLSIDHASASDALNGGFVFVNEGAPITVSVQHSVAANNSHGFFFNGVYAQAVSQNTASANAPDFYFCDSTGIDTAALLTANHNTFTTFLSC